MIALVKPPADPESFLCHARKAAPINAAAAETIGQLVAESVSRFLENWDEAFGTEDARLTRIIDHLDAALAAIVAEEWTFRPDDEEDDSCAPFHDEQSALAWLRGDGESGDAGEPGDYLDDDRDWLVRSVWNARKEVAAQHASLIGWDKARWKTHWTRPPATTSRLPEPLQELIFDLARIWHDHVDRDLGLPRRDPDPDNPLLRFIDAGLSLALGERRPKKSQLLQFVADHARPAIRKQQQDEEASREELRELREEVDSDPFSGP